MFSFSEHTSNHAFIRARSSDSRAPCPALNALANHGYISRTGTHIAFFDLVNALMHVYNITYVLAIFLALPGFLTCGHITAPPPLHSESRSFALTIFNNLRHMIAFPFMAHWTLDLSDLSARGTFKIAHDASFVHPNGVSSTHPDPALIAEFLHKAHALSDARTQSGDGMTLEDMACYHAQRVAGMPLDILHEQIALGECAFAWLILRTPALIGKVGVVPSARLEEWFGQERLPEGWWANGVRPDKKIGMLDIRRWTEKAGTFSGKK